MQERFLDSIGQKRHVNDVPITSGLPDEETFSIPGGMSQNASRHVSRCSRLRKSRPIARAPGVGHGFERGESLSDKAFQAGSSVTVFVAVAIFRSC